MLLRRPRIFLFDAQRGVFYWHRSRLGCLSMPEGPAGDGHIAAAHARCLVAGPNRRPDSLEASFLCSSRGSSQLTEGTAARAMRRSDAYDLLMEAAIPTIAMLRQPFRELPTACD
jgi:hypothetical protein